MMQKQSQICTLMHLFEEVCKTQNFDIRSFQLQTCTSKSTGKVKVDKVENSQPQVENSQPFSFYFKL